jgi:hypothetical protein
MDDKEKKQILKSIAKLQQVDKVLFNHKQLLGTTGRNASMMIENVIEKLQNAVAENTETEGVQ